MAGFNDAVVLQRSEQKDEEGKTLTIYDLHDYVDNDEGITYADILSRVFAFYNADGELIGSVDATVVLLDDYSITIEVEKDEYLLSRLIITLNDSTEYSNDAKIGMIQKSQFKLNKLRERNRLSKQEKLKDIIVQADQIVESAVNGHLYGDAPYLFNDRMDDAHKFLDSVSYC